MSISFNTGTPFIDFSNDRDLESLIEKDVVPERQGLEFFGLSSSSIAQMEKDVAVPNVEVSAWWPETPTNQVTTTNHKKRKGVNFEEDQDGRVQSPFLTEEDLSCSNSGVLQTSEKEAPVSEGVSRNGNKLQKTSNTTERLEGPNLETTQTALACLREILGPNCKGDEEIDKLCETRNIDRGIVDKCAKFCHYLLGKLKKLGTEEDVLKNKITKGHVAAHYNRFNFSIVLKWVQLLREGTGEEDKTILNSIGRIGFKIGLDALFKNHRSKINIKKRKGTNFETSEEAACRAANTQKALACLKEILGSNCKDGPKVNELLQTYQIDGDTLNKCMQFCHYILNKLEVLGMENVLKSRYIGEYMRARYREFAPSEALKWVQSLTQEGTGIENEEVIKKIKRMRHLPGFVI